MAPETIENTTTNQTGPNESYYLARSQRLVMHIFLSQRKQIRERQGVTYVCCDYAVIICSEVSGQTSSHNDSNNCRDGGDEHKGPCHRQKCPTLVNVAFRRRHVFVFFHCKGFCLDLGL